VNSAANDHLLDATSYLIAGSSVGQVWSHEFNDRSVTLPRDERVIRL
jgi:hypothetical protein